MLTAKLVLEGISFLNDISQIVDAMRSGSMLDVAIQALQAVVPFICRPDFASLGEIGDTNSLEIAEIIEAIESVGVVA